MKNVASNEGKIIFRAIKEAVIIYFNTTRFGACQKGKLLVTYGQRDAYDKE